MTSEQIIELDYLFEINRKIVVEIQETNKKYIENVCSFQELLTSKFPNYGLITSALGRKIYVLMRKHQENNSTETINWNVEMQRIIDEIDKEFGL